MQLVERGRGVGEVGGRERVAGLGICLLEPEEDDRRPEVSRGFGVVGGFLLCDQGSVLALAKPEGGVGEDGEFML